METFLRVHLLSVIPNFSAPGTDFGEDNFSVDGGGEDGFRMIQVDYVYLHFISNLMPLLI